MMWLLLAFLSAALLGFYDVFKKQSLKDNAVIPVLFLNTLFSSLIFLPFIVWSVWKPETLENSIFYVPVAGWEVHRYVVLKSVIVLSGVGIFWDEESSYHDRGAYKRHPSGDGAGRGFSGLW